MFMHGGLAHLFETCFFFGFRDNLETRWEARYLTFISVRVDCRVIARSCHQPSEWEYAIPSLGAWVHLVF
jgi:membrane associated rhomboid family serine protease